MDIQRRRFGALPARVFSAAARTPAGKRLPRKGRVMALAPFWRKDLRLELVERFIELLGC